MQLGAQLALELPTVLQEVSLGHAAGVQQPQELRPDSPLRELPAWRLCYTADWDLEPATGDPPGPMLDACCRAWLRLQESDGQAVQQLQAAGFDTSSVTQQLQELLAARDAANSSMDEANLQALAQQLHAAGSALSTLAVPSFCNNPACSNLSGPSELQLVGGKSRLCAGCRTARYCSKGCQKQHWKQHKPVCRALAEATKGAAAV